MTISIVRVMSITKKTTQEEGMVLLCRYFPQTDLEVELVANLATDRGSTVSGGILNSSTGYGATISGGDAVDPFTTPDQINDYVVDLVDFTSGWGTTWPLCMKNCGSCSS